MSLIFSLYLKLFGLLSKSYPNLCKNLTPCLSNKNLSFVFIFTTNIEESYVFFIYLDRRIIVFYYYIIDIDILECMDYNFKIEEPNGLNYHYFNL